MSEETTKKIVIEVLSQINKTLYKIALGILGVLVVAIIFIISAFSGHSENITTNRVTNERQDISIKEIKDEKADADVVEMIYKALIRIEDKIDKQ